MDARLRERIDELEQGLLTAGGVPVDVAQRTQAWLKSTAQIMSADLGRAASPVEPPRSLTAASDAARVRRAAIAQSTDVAWLCATARGAGLLERRAALTRLTAVAAAARGEMRTAIESLLARKHASELSLDTMRLAIALAGAGARDARERLEHAKREGARFSEAIGAFVDGVAASEPLGALAANDRAQLLLHLRAHSADVAAYVATEVERGLTTSDVDDLLDLLSALRPCADRRLLPSLSRAVLDDARPEVRGAAASVLARIDDARAPRVLGLAWGRASDVVERLVLAEGLGLWGERRGIDAVRAALDETDELYKKLALHALAALADPDLTERSYAIAEQSRAREVRIAAVRAIGRGADARGLPWLDALERQPDSPEVILGAVDMARDAILGRLKARGETPPARYERRADALERALARPPGATVTRAHRLLARWTLVRARIARLFGRARSTAAAYTRAAAIDPTFVLPPLMEARWRMKRGDLIDAVRCFRRVIAIDASALSRRPADLSAAVHALLRRADDLEEQGRREMAREILEDLFGLDLTGCAPALRVEVRRRRDRPLLAARPPTASTPGISGPWPAHPHQEVT